MVGGLVVPVLAGRRYSRFDRTPEEGTVVRSRAGRIPVDHRYSRFDLIPVGETIVRLDRIQA
jgi:hypothetical protein